MGPIGALFLLVGIGSVFINILALISYLITGIGEGSGVFYAMSANTLLVTFLVSSLVGSFQIVSFLGDFIPYAVSKLSTKDKEL